MRSSTTFSSAALVVAVVAGLALVLAALGSPLALSVVLAAKGLTGWAATSALAPLLAVCALVTVPASRRALMAAAWRVGDVTASTASGGAALFAVAGAVCAVAYGFLSSPLVGCAVTLTVAGVVAVSRSLVRLQPSALNV